MIRTKPAYRQIWFILISGWLFNEIPLLWAKGCDMYSFSVLGTPIHTRPPPGGAGLVFPQGVEPA